MSIESDYLVNLIRDLIAEQMASAVHSAIGYVTNYDSASFTASVQLHYEAIETPMIRIGSGAIGEGFGDKAPLNLWDEVIVTFYGGTLETGVITARLYGPEVNAAPTTADPNDRLIKHSSGSEILFAADGGMTVSNPNGSVVLTKDGLVTVQNSGIKLVLDPAGTIKVANSGAELISLLDQLMTQLTTSPNILVSYPSGVGSFNPATTALLQQIKTSLETLKSS